MIKVESGCEHFPTYPSNLGLRDHRDLDKWAEVRENGYTSQILMASAGPVSQMAEEPNLHDIYSRQRQQSRDIANPTPVNIVRKYGFITKCCLPQGARMNPCS